MIDFFCEERSSQVSVVASSGPERESAAFFQIQGLQVNICVLQFIVEKDVK